MSFFVNSFKHIIFLINLIFFGLGSYLFYNTFQQLRNDVFELDSALKSPIYFTLLVAIIITFISFLGCCGTLRENRCMLKTYGFFILLCIILQIAIIVMASRIDPDRIGEEVKKNLIHNFANQSSTVQKSIQIIQFNSECCGVDGWRDYDTHSTRATDFPSFVPDSCCGLFEETSSPPNATGHCSMEKLSKIQGCKVKLTELLKENYKSGYIVAACLFVFQLIVIFMSCTLSKNIDEQYYAV